MRTESPLYSAVQPLFIDRAFKPHEKEGRLPWGDAALCSRLTWTALSGLGSEQDDHPQDRLTPSKFPQTTAILRIVMQNLAKDVQKNQPLKENFSFKG
jgi:hypothetical protein